MSDDWLAAWDGATEEERRLVLEKLAAIGHGWFRVAAHRDGSALVVGACTYHKEWFAAQSGSDYDRSYVDVGAIRVDAGVVTYETLLEYEEQFRENEGPDDEPWARGIVEQQLAHTMAERRIEKACEAAGPTIWGPRVRAWPAVADGPLRVVGVCWSYRVATPSGLERQLVGVDEITIDGIRVVGEQTLVRAEIDIADPTTHDNTKTANGVIEQFMAREPRPRCVPQRR